MKNYKNIYLEIVISLKVYFMSESMHGFESLPAFVSLFKKNNMFFLINQPIVTQFPRQ